MSHNVYFSETDAASPGHRGEINLTEERIVINPNARGKEKWMADNESQVVFEHAEIYQVYLSNSRMRFMALKF